MIAARLVIATGEVIEVGAEKNADLWWGLRGAGHNFGIISQLTVKAYPQVNGGMHWNSMLGFAGSEESVSTVSKAITEMGGMGKGMACTLMFARMPPNFQVRTCHHCLPEMH